MDGGPRGDGEVGGKGTPAGLPDGRDHGHFPVKMVEKRIKMHPPLLHWCVLCRSVPRLTSPRLFLLAVDDVGYDVIKKLLGSMAYYTVPHPPPGGSLALHSYTAVGPCQDLATLDTSRNAKMRM